MGHNPYIIKNYISLLWCHVGVLPTSRQLLLIQYKVPFTVSVVVSYSFCRALNIINKSEDIQTMSRVEGIYPMTTNHFGFRYDILFKLKSL